MKKHIIIAVLLSFVMATSILADITPEYAQVLEDLNIMSAIIDKTLAKAFPGEYREPQFLFTGGTDKCQGFYLKDYGVLFMVNVNFPVSTTNLDNEKKQVKSDDLWERTKQELDGVSVYTYYAPTQHQSFDQAKVDRLKDELLKVVGEYSSNIRQLRPDDAIAIIIRSGKGDLVTVSPWVSRYVKPAATGTNTLDSMVASEYGRTQQSQPKSPAAGATKGSANTPEAPTQSVASTVPSPVEFLDVSDIASVYTPSASGGTSSSGEAGATSPYTSAVQAYNQLLWVDRGGAVSPYTNQSVARTTMIISVKKRDVTDLKDGKIKFEDFAKRAEIIQY